MCLSASIRWGGPPVADTYSEVKAENATLALEANTTSSANDTIPVPILQTSNDSVVLNSSASANEIDSDMKTLRLIRPPPHWKKNPRIHTQRA